MDIFTGLSLFTGSGIGDLVFKEIIPGYRTCCYVENEPFCIAHLIKSIKDGLIDDAPIWDDIRTFDTTPYQGMVDIVTGGFPCQAFSTASHGVIVAEDLWPSMLRVIIGTAPRYIFAENVSRKAIAKASQDLRDIGYATQTVPCSAADVGADHIRKRYWLLGDSHNEAKSMCSLDDEAPRLPRVQESVWACGPDSKRVVNGLAGRVDRLKMLGNGQVPQCISRILNVQKIESQ